MVTTFTTAGLPPGQRLSRWQDAVSSSFVPLGCSAADGTINGVIEHAALATIEVSSVRASNQLVTRSASDISARADDECYLLGIQTQGYCRVKQNGRAAVLDHGACAIYDTRRPYTLDLSDDFEQLVVRLPAEFLELNFAPSADTTAVRFDADHGPAAVLGTAVRSLIDEAEFLTPSAAHHTSRGIESLIMATLSSPSEETDPRHGPPRLQLILDVIEDRLKDPALDVRLISAELNLSPRTVHRAFATESTTAAEYIRSRRLDAAHRLLASGSHRGTIAEVAYAWGFSDAAHFTRAFRRRFGRPPSSVAARTA